jgi:putative ABC transport system permease protein
VQTKPPENQSGGFRYLMELNKRYARNLKSNLAFYVSVAFLTAISAFLMVSMYTSVSMIDTDFAEIMLTGNVEDAQFTTLTAIDPEGIKTIENEYNAELEEIHTVDIEETGYTLRVFAPTEKINRYQMLEGSNLLTENDILLNRDFALAHDLVVGDRFVMAGNPYSIAGFAVRPDYLYAQKDTRDFYINKAIFGQVTMTQSAFDKLPYTRSYYAIVYQEENSVEVRRYLNEHYVLLSYMSATSNNRIDVVRNFVEEYGIMLGALIPVLFAMITIIVAVVLGRAVRREQKQIGTLVALGYRKRELVRHYIVYGAIPGIFGSIIGIALAVIFIQPVCTLFAIDYEQINFNIKIYWVSVLIALVVPALLYMLMAIFSVLRLLRKNTVLLLSGSKDASKQIGHRFLINTRLSFDKKFRLRALLVHKSRTLVVIMGMFVGTFLCAFGLIMIDSSNYLIDKGLDTAGTYEYQYFLNTIKTGTPQAGEQELCFNFEVTGYEKLFTLSGIIENPQYLRLTTRSGNAIQYGGYYLTSNAAALYGVVAGENFTFINPFTTEQYTVKILDILDDNMQCILYTSLKNVSELLGLAETSYNTILSDNKIDLDASSVAYTNSKENMKKQLQYTIDLIMVFVYLMLAFGAVLCIITVYLTVNMLVEENRHNISMLKVLGYRKREINRLVLNVNHILVPISLTLGIWMCIKLCEKMFEEFIAVLNIYIEPSITIFSVLLCATVLVISYAASLSLLKRKVYKIDIVESLKDNRE